MTHLSSAQQEEMQAKFKHLIKVGLDPLFEVLGKSKTSEDLIDALARGCNVVANEYIGNAVIEARIDENNTHDKGLRKAAEESNSFVLYSAMHQLYSERNKKLKEKTSNE